MQPAWWSMDSGPTFSVVLLSGDTALPSSTSIRTPSGHRPISEYLSDSPGPILHVRGNTLILRPARSGTKTGIRPLISARKYRGRRTKGRVCSLVELEGRRPPPLTARGDPVSLAWIGCLTVKEQFRTEFAVQCWDVDHRRRTSSRETATGDPFHGNKDGKALYSYLLIHQTDRVQRGEFAARLQRNTSKG
ncbi:hypothetical protein DFH06DRAFT_1386313 [Mycena polygramma]|nr:hypothetical protein DFH06DRAFT_1386313 [Mycena polygramma]